MQLLSAVAHTTLRENVNAQAMTEAVAEGLREAGCEVNVFNTNEGRFDITQFPQYDCAAFGSPDYYSYVAGNLKQSKDDHYGGRVIDAMKGIFGRVGTQVGDPMGSRGYPSAGVLEQCKALGKVLAQAVLR
ncbi:MAG: hypothetical protein ACYTEQ_26155 [Planctomycetota bacterium]|jgi:flavorubredoxin